MRIFEDPYNLAHPRRWWDWPAVLLLMAAVINAAIRLNATNWTRDLDLVQTVTLLGLIAGLALGQSKFTRGAASFLAFSYGAFVVVWLIGLTLGRGILWPERLVSMLARLSLTFNQIYQQKPVTDNLFFNLLMSALFWALSVSAGYSLTRHGSPWRAILPTGLALVVVHSYDAFFPVRAWFLASYIFLSLLLIARMHFIKLRHQWRENGTYLPPYIGLDSYRLGFITTVILLLFAWTVPALASSFSPAEHVWRRAIQPWTDIRNRLSNVFYSLQASVGVVTDFYGDTLPLGRGSPLTDTVIMTIEAPPRPAPGVRFYWSSRVYDYYDGSWSSTTEDVRPVQPNDFNLPYPEYQNRETGVFRFKTNFAIQNLSTPTNPIWVSRPADAFLYVNPDGTVDLSHLKATPLIQAGDMYQVEASIATASVADLRAAGVEYPDWIKNRYLQLPDTITPRTKELAERLAAGLDNPYDIATTITEFLRRHLEFSDSVPPVPGNQEPVDWVLFEHRKAFCNYYATAEVVLLRSLGIPARLAVGYAEGQLLNISGDEFDRAFRVGAPQVYTFSVRHRDAHAWPEVYFPNIGWVEFEPTVSQRPLRRPAGDEADLAGAQANEPDDTPAGLAAQNIFREEELFTAASLQDAGSVEIPTAVWVLLAVILIVAAGYGIRRVRIRRSSPPVPIQIERSLRAIGLKPPDIVRRWAKYASLPSTSRAYLEINRALKRLGHPASPADTPAERAFSLIKLLPRIEVYIRDLLAAYHAIAYSNGRQRLLNAARVGKEIRKDSYLELVRRILRTPLVEQLRDRSRRSLRQPRAES